MLHLTESGEGVSLELRCLRLGKDYMVALTGGSRPHLGAAALAVARPSLADPEKTGASVSVLTVTGHKDDEMARYAADLLTRALGSQVLVGCGIHVDGITPPQLREVSRLTERLLQRLTQAIKSGREE